LKPSKLEAGLVRQKRAQRWGRRGSLVGISTRNIGVSRRARQAIALCKWDRMEIFLGNMKKKKTPRDSNCASLRLKQSGESGSVREMFLSNWVLEVHSAISIVKLGRQPNPPLRNVSRRRNSSFETPGSKQLTRTSTTSRYPKQQLGRYTSHPSRSSLTSTPRHVNTPPGIVAAP